MSYSDTRAAAIERLERDLSALVRVQPVLRERGGRVIQTRVAELIADMKTQMEAMKRLQEEDQ